MPEKDLDVTPAIFIAMLDDVVRVVAPDTVEEFDIPPPIPTPPASTVGRLPEDAFWSICPFTATRTVLPGGTATVFKVMLPVPLGVETGVASTSAPPSLPMISLVIANLNPRDLMQLASAGIEVVVTRDSVRNIHRFAYA